MDIPVLVVSLFIAILHDVTLCIMSRIIQLTQCCLFFYLILHKVNPTNRTPSTNHLERSAQEAAVAAAAAYGADTINYGVGENPRKKAHVDLQDPIDVLAQSMQKDSEMFGSAMKSVVSIMGGSTESPGRKNQRRYKDITENMKLLRDEIKEAKEMGMPTEQAEEEYAYLSKSRSEIRAALRSAANLGPAFNNES